jgi:DegV family protein with EDD domain
VTDSTADLPPGLLEREGLAITTVPLSIHFGTETFRDKIDLSNADFFARLKASTVLPTTSQPSVGDFEAVFQRLLASGDAVCAIHLSSHLSGTFQAASLAASAVSGDGAQIRVVDSLNASLGLGLLVIAAARLARDGASLDDVVTHMRHLIPRVNLVFMIDTMEYLVRGGRVGRAQGFIGSLLHIKPILRLDEGQVVPLRRERTRARAIDALVSIAADLGPVATLGVIHSDAPDAAHALALRLAGVVTPAVAPDSIPISELGPVVGTHAGPNCVGFAAVTGDA